MSRLLSLLACLLLLAACSDQSVLNSLSSKSGYSVATNIVFDPTTGLKLDVYTPDGARNAPVVVFYYGGRWEVQDTKQKDAYEFVGAALASQGFVVVIPDYRLYPNVKFPAFVQDSAWAVRWVHDSINHYGGDPKKVVLMGHSSGAYNAAMLALNEQYLKEVGGTRTWLRGMVGLAGPYDFLPITAPDLRDIFGPPDRFQQTQPVFWADGHNPPLLLVHGEDDANVYVVNTRSLADRVQRAGGAVTTLIYPKLSHEMILACLSSTLRSRADVLQNVADFVRKNTSGAPPAENFAPSIQTVPLADSPIQSRPLTHR